MSKQCEISESQSKKLLSVLLYDSIEDTKTIIEQSEALGKALEEGKMCNLCLFMEE